MPYTNPDPTSYYQVQKALYEWEEFEKYCGTNYVSECYIQKYKGILAELEGSQGGGLSKADMKIVKEMGVDEEGFNEQLEKRIRQLKNKKLKGTNDWMDDMLYETYTDLLRERRQL